MNDLKDSTHLAYHHFEDKSADGVPAVVNRDGIYYQKKGQPQNNFNLDVSYLDSFLSEAIYFNSLQPTNQHTMVAVTQDNVLALFRFPHWCGQRLELPLILTDEAKAWLHRIEHISSPKALGEFVEDYGDWLNAPQDVHQDSQLDLVHALTQLKITNKTEGSIEFRPHGDHAEFSIARDAKTKAVGLELPVMLYATPQLWICRNKAYRIKVRINYAVTENSEVTVRCKVVNAESLMTKAVKELADDIALELDDHANIRVIY